VEQIHVTRGQAIAAKCRDCAGDSADLGNWKQQVTACSVESCPLYPFRPVSSKPLPDALMQAWGIEVQPSTTSGTYIAKNDRTASELGLNDKPNQTGEAHLPGNPQAKTEPVAEPPATAAEESK
jgi:hypothetical protein